jgi:prepilin-type N-terminal cleavage/methylation domain-containing protein
MTTRKTTFHSLTSHLRGHHGFTLTEMMMTITILGVALAVATPNFRSSFDRARFDRASSEIQSDIRLAVSTAKLNGRAVRFDFSESGYALVDAADTTQVYRSRDYGADFVLVADRNPIVFPWGQVQPTQVQVSSQSHIQNFLILPTGRVELAN